MFFGEDGAGIWEGVYWGVARRGCMRDGTGGGGDEWSVMVEGYWPMMWKLGHIDKG